MNSSQKSKVNPKSLTELLNWLWSVDKTWKLDAWNDETGKKIKLEIDFSKFKISVAKGTKDLPPRELANLVWQAGYLL